MVIVCLFVCFLSPSLSSGPRKLRLLYVYYILLKNSNFFQRDQKEIDINF